MIKVVLFDLDDTLYPEIDYVKSGFRAVASQLNKKTLYARLWRLWQQDKNNVYQRAALSCKEVDTAIQIYRFHKPNIRLKKNVIRMLTKLRKVGFSIGIITDGRPEGQRFKIEALGLNELTDRIIITDELGGVNFRKPNPTAFELMKNFFNSNYDEMIYIGDNPKKDFIAPTALGMKTCFLQSKNSIYSKNVNPPDTDFRIRKVTHIIKILTGGTND